MLYLLPVLLNRLIARVRDERGELSIEYVLIAGLVSIAIIGGMALLTPAIGTWFTSITTSVTGAMP